MAEQQGGLLVEAGLERGSGQRFPSGLLKHASGELAARRLPAGNHLRVARFGVP